MDVLKLQTALRKIGLYSGDLDAIYGEKTEDAIRALLLKHHVKGWQGWEKSRLMIAAGQAIAEEAGIEAGEIDGLLGPQTRYAFEAYDTLLKTGSAASETMWRDKEVGLPEPPSKDAAQKWPRQKEVEKFFGPIGTNQTSLVLPYPCKLAWNPSQVVLKIQCHEKVANPALRVLTRAADHYGDSLSKLGLDLFGGCLNVRKMRGGSAWSMHSWGIAFDFDPANNQLKWGRDRASFARPAFEKWFDLWEEEGAISLGRARNYDWMHTQFARL